MTGARIEVAPDEFRVYAPYSDDLLAAMRKVPGAYWTPGHWTVPLEHRAEVSEVVEVIYGPPLVVDPPDVGGRA